MKDALSVGNILIRFRSATRPAVSMRQLIKNHQAFFFDSHGVLRARTGCYPGVEKTLKEILKQGKVLGIASNTAESSPADIQRAWHDKGVAIPLENIITSGMLLKGYVQKKRLNKAPAIIIGNEQSRKYARQAGLVPLPPVMASVREAEVVVICERSDDNEAIDAAINAILANNIPVALATTDRLVPYYHDRAARGVSIGVLGIRYLIGQITGVVPEAIGKPAQGMFNKVIRILQKNGLGKQDALFIGDNLYEDILGANNAGLPSLLVESGMSGMYSRGWVRGPIADFDRSLLAQGVLPTYQLPSILL
jgi:glycerol-1-phosphatase